MMGLMIEYQTHKFQSNVKVIHLEQNQKEIQLVLDQLEILVVVRRIYRFS